MLGLKLEQLMATKTPSAGGAVIVDGLGVQLLAGSALRLQQHGGVGGGNLLRQGFDLGGCGGDGHDVVKGVFRAVGPADAAQDLTAAPLHGLQLLPGLIGVLQEGDHGEAAGPDSVLIDWVEIDEIEVLDLLPGDVEDGRSASSTSGSRAPGRRSRSR